MTKSKTVIALLSAVVSTVTIGMGAMPASAAMIGKCEVSGKKGETPFPSVTANQLTVVTNLPNPGWWNGDTVDTIADGYEYCFAVNIAYRAGLDTVKLVNVPFDAIVAGRVRDYDLAISEISITEPRKKVVTFSVPYFSSDVGVLVKKGTKLDSDSIKTMRLGVKQATTGQQFISEKVKPAEIKVFPDNPSMFAALMAGQIDAAIHDTSIVLAQASESKGKLEVAGQYSTGEMYGAIYPKTSTNDATLDTIIEGLKTDGTLDKLTTKYLAPVWGVDPASIAHLHP